MEKTRRDLSLQSNNGLFFSNPADLLHLSKLLIGRNLFLRFGMISLCFATGPFEVLASCFHVLQGVATLGVKQNISPRLEIFFKRSSATFY